MPEKRVSEYMKMTTRQLKEEARSRMIHLSGNKNQLAGGVMLNDINLHNITVIHDWHYRPTKEDRKYGIVSNMPLCYQELVCSMYGFRLQDECGFSHPYRDDDGEMFHPISKNPRKEFKEILLSMMAFTMELCEEAFLYLGLPSDFINRETGEVDWKCPADEEGRVFVDLLVDNAVKAWEDATANWKEDDCSSRPWGDVDPEVFNLTEIKREEIRKIEKQKLLKSTWFFLYGCASQKSGSQLLPLIGARYAYGPVRKTIAEYAGAV